MAYTANPAFLFAPNWEEGVLERLGWRTSAMISEIGAEQRIPLRLTPSRVLEASFLIQQQNRQYFQHLVGRHGTSDWLIPLWHQVTKLGASAALGTDVLTLDTRWREYKVGDMVILRNRRDARIWEAIEIEAITDSTLTLVSNLEKTWPAGSIVYPARLAKLQEMVSGSKKTDELFEVRAQFSISEKNPYTSDWTPDSTYQDEPVFDHRPDDSEDLTFDFKRYTSSVDNELGIPDLFDIAGRPFRRMQYRWSFAGREANHDFRQLLYYLKGRFRSVWIPTFMADLTIAANVTDDDDNITVKRVSYHDSDILNLPWDDIRIELRDGTVSYHRVVASSIIDANTEQLGLETAIADGFTIAQVARISYMMKVRLDQDSIEINHAADTEGLTQTVVTWYETAAEVPVEVVEEPEDWGSLWLTSMFDFTASNNLYPIGPWVFLEEEEELLLPLYTDTGIEWHRHSADDFALIDVVDDLTDDWDTDGGGFIDDPEGFVWLCAAYSAFTYRINKTTWAVTSVERVAVAVPVEHRPYVSDLTELTTGYYSPTINPYDNNVYMSDMDAFNVLHLINKGSGTFQPSQTFIFDPLTVDLESPFTGVVDTEAYYDGGIDFIVSVGSIVFTSADDAYMNDFNTSNIFHLDLETGNLQYQFRLVNGSGAFSQHYPLYYDSPSNTMWFWGTNNSWYEVFLGAPILTANSLRAWVVGSDPSTIIDYPLMWDHQMLVDGTVGDQYFSELAAPTMTVDKFNRGLWIGYGIAMGGATNVPSDGASGMRFFSFVDKEITKIAGDNITPTSGFQGSFFGGVGITSETTGWCLAPFVWDVPEGIGSATDYKAIRLDYTEVRTLELARYVRITIYGSAAQARNGTDTAFNGLGGPVGLQEIEVHSELGGANVAVSVVASSTASGFPASNLLDEELVDKANSWRAETTSYPQVLTVDLGSVDTPVFEVLMWPINSRLNGIGAYAVNVYSEGAYIAPGIFDIDVSVDGSTWVHKRRYQGVKAWAIGTNVAVDAPAARVFQAF